MPRKIDVIKEYVTKEGGFKVDTLVLLDVLLDVRDLLIKIESNTNEGN